MLTRSRTSSNGSTGIILLYIYGTKRISNYIKKAPKLSTKGKVTTRSIKHSFKYLK